MIRNSQIRRTLLILSGAAFLVIAIGSLFWPEWMAGGLSYRLSDINAFNEFRAIYVGLWLAHVALFAMAAIRIEHTALGDIGAMLILGQVAGRVISILMDGFPTPAFLPMMTLEPLAGLGILLVRPSAAETARPADPPAL